MQPDSRSDSAAAIVPFLAPRATSLAGWRKVVALVIERHPVYPVGALYSILWLAFSIWHAVPFASVETDGMEYIQTAQSLFTRGFSYSSFHGIGYPAAIWLFHLLIPDWFAAARVVSGLSGLMLVAAAVGLFGELFGSPAALTGGILVVTNFFIAAYAGMAMSDMLGAALALAALWLIVCIRHPARYAAAGVLVGLAAVTRYPYFGLILAGGLVWLLEQTNAARLRATALYLGVFVLGAAPLLLSNWISFGSPLANSNFANLGGWFYASPRAAAVHSWADAFDVMASAPAFFAFGYIKQLSINLPIYLARLLGPVLFFSGAGWLLVLAGPVKRNKSLFALGTLAAYLLVAGLGFITEGRFWLYVIPFFAGGCGYLIVRLWQDNRRIGAALFALVLIGNIAVAAARLPHLLESQAPEYQRAGQAIRADSSVGERILVTQPQIALYAERPATLQREVSAAWADLSGIVSQRGIAYVVMDDRYGTGHYPELARLYDPAQVQAAFPGWQLIYHETAPWRIVVYRVSEK